MATVLFLQDLFEEYTGTTILSACLKRAGHSTDILIERKINKIIQCIKETSPDLIAFSVMTGPHKWGLETAKEINYITDDQINLLKEWRDDPFEWGEKHGFPKVN